MKYNLFTVTFLAIFFSLLIVMLVPQVSAAKISGTVYDENLIPMRNVLLDINSTPHQRILITRGDYDVELNPGFYTLIFTKLNYENEDKVTEHLLVKDNAGEYRFDIFFIPDTTSQEDVLNDSTIPPNPDIFDIQKEKGARGVLFRFFEVILVVILLYLLYIGWKRISKKKSIVDIPEEKTLEKIEKSDVTTDKIIELLKKNQGRMTQKELRRIIPYSEAKVSLIISEMESEGIIKRVKKGRGNIIILKE